MGKPTELMQLLKTGNSDAARKLIAKMKKSGKYRAASEKQPFETIIYLPVHAKQTSLIVCECVYELRDRVNHGFVG